MLTAENKKKLTCVFGLGMSGISAARYLERIKEPFFVFDSRNNATVQAELSHLSYCKGIYFGSIEQQRLNEAKKIIISPGIPLDNPYIQGAKRAGVQILGDIELFAIDNKKKIIAVTGSNGKSTVTDLTYRILCAAGLKAQIGGNFGKPVLDYLPENEESIYVLELSSFQLDTLSSLEADVAVVLNISEDHMDRYLKFQDYIHSKLSIYNHSKRALFNLDEPLTIRRDIKNYASFSLNNAKSDYFAEKVGNQVWLNVKGKQVVNVNELNITGKQNWSNVLAALALTSELGVTITRNMIDEIKAYAGLPHRFQLIDRRRLKPTNIDWINDSKATNVGATKAALESIDTSYYSSVVLIAGGDSKGNDLAILEGILRDKVNLLVLIGKDADLFSGLFETRQLEMASNMKDAVEKAYAYLNQKKVSEKRKLVLLSPACASFDMYKSFEERGNAFIQAVEACAA